MKIELEDLKFKYQKAYSKAKEISCSPQQQKLLLQKLVEDIFVENIKKIKEEDPGVPEEEVLQKISELRNLLNEWNDEFKRSLK